MAQKAGGYTVVEHCSAPTTPAGLVAVEQLDMHSSLAALGQPAHRTGLFVVAEIVCATSPMVLDQQQS